MSETKRPKIGVGVIVVKDDKVLLGKRKGSHGEATWSFPGGHLEYGEAIEECAKRETKEEAGIEVKNIRVSTFTNDVFEDENKHYVTLYVISDYNLGKVKVCEPEKCEEWGWFSWSSLPNPLFLPVENLLKQNFNPFA